MQSLTHQKTRLGIVWLTVRLFFTLRMRTALCPARPMVLTASSMTSWGLRMPRKLIFYYYLRLHRAHFIICTCAQHTVLSMDWTASLSWSSCLFTTSWGFRNADTTYVYFYFYYSICTCAQHTVLSKDWTAFSMTSWKLQYHVGFSIISFFLSYYYYWRMHTAYCPEKRLYCLFHDIMRVTDAT